MSVRNRSRTCASRGRAASLGTGAPMTVEHVCGTFKAWMGSSHFWTETLPRLSTEISLQALACDLQRTVKILGAEPLMATMKA